MTLVDDFDTAFALIVTANTPSEVFGMVDDEEAKAYFRRLARLTHPDTARTQKKDLAEEAFRRLTEMWDRRSASDGREFEIRTPKNTYHVSEEVAKGDVANLFGARAVGAGGAEDVLVKLPRSKGNSDLIVREAAALTRIGEQVDPKYAAYFPRLHETFTHQDASGMEERKVNALVRLPGMHTLAQVKAAYPGGLDARDAAWMWRRLLVALGAAHRAGVVHGAVLPENVLIHAGAHGLVLLDWCYSVTDGAGHVPAVVEAYRDWYPVEVTQKETPTEATDLHLAAKTMHHLMGPRTPKPLQAFVKGCTLPTETMRPHDAWVLLGELDELLERMYGPRRFREFHMPGTDDTNTNNT